MSQSSKNKALGGIDVEHKEKWGGYNSYEAYINRGLDGIFHTDKVENEADGGSSVANNATVAPANKRTRIKSKDVYGIVASYPHHKDDKQWLVDTLLTLPFAKRRSVMFRYGQVYNSAQSAVGDNKEQTNQERREANTWLLEYIEQQLDKQVNPHTVSHRTTP